MSASHCMQRPSKPGSLRGVVHSAIHVRETLDESTLTAWQSHRDAGRRSSHAGPSALSYEPLSGSVQGHMASKRRASELYTAPCACLGQPCMTMDPCAAVHSLGSPRGLGTSQTGHPGHAGFAPARVAVVVCSEARIGMWPGRGKASRHMNRYDNRSVRKSCCSADAFALPGGGKKPTQGRQASTRTQRRAHTHVHAYTYAIAI